MLAGTEVCITQHLAGATVREFECLRCRGRPYKSMEFRKLVTSVDVAAGRVAHDSKGLSEFVVDVSIS